MSKFIFWGTGKYAIEGIMLFENNKQYTDDEVLLFVDNDEDKIGGSFKKYKVENPSVIKDLKFDYLVICSAAYKDIVNQIIFMGLCDTSIVWSMVEYREYLYSKEKYYKKYNSIESSMLDANKSNEKKITVYTAIIGEYDDLKEPQIESDKVKYVCFTNNNQLKSRKWEMHYIENREDSNVLLARKIKILAHHFIDTEDELVWVDGKCLILGDLSEYVIKYKKNSSLICFPHFERDCIVDEAAVLAKGKPDQKKESFIQVARYLQEGMPLNYGLYETACLVRDMSDPVVRDLMEQWWYEVSHYSYRDQISLPYIFWKNNYEPDICDQNITNNKWIRFEKHK